MVLPVRYPAEPPEEDGQELVFDRIEDGTAIYKWAESAPAPEHFWFCDVCGGLVDVLDYKVETELAFEHRIDGHVHDPNTVTERGHCANFHYSTRTYKRDCPIRGCEWNAESDAAAAAAFKKIEQIVKEDADAVSELRELRRVLGAIVYSAPEHTIRLSHAALRIAPELTLTTWETMDETVVMAALPPERVTVPLKGGAAESGTLTVGFGDVAPADLAGGPIPRGYFEQMNYSTAEEVRQRCDERDRDLAAAKLAGRCAKCGAISWQIDFASQTCPDCKNKKPPESSS